MADNIPIIDGQIAVDVTMATKEVAGKQYHKQMVALSTGTLVDNNNPLPVDVKGSVQIFLEEDHLLPTSNIPGVLDSLGNMINPESFEVNYTYTSGVLTTEWFTDEDYIWTRTYTYTSGLLTKVSKWVRTEA